jgi:spore maturation protein CgeB
VKIVVFCHSLVSDWNHGNAHFLRGISSELLHRGHELRVLEPTDAWSRTHLVAQHGRAPEDEFARSFPRLRSERYDLAALDLDAALDRADLVLVHEWSDPELVRRLGAHRERTGAYRLLFHDTHHRAVTRPHAMARFDLRAYDGVLAFGEIIRQLYLERGWAQRAWTWHEAADTRVFAPRPHVAVEHDLTWIGNWGDGERTRELHEFLLRPARRLRVTGTIHGVRYPLRARLRIATTSLRYRGWLANHRAPDVFARHRLTLHVPRRPYVRALPGIPTIRPFEAMACGIPMICSPWEDAEGLFRHGVDYLVARDGDEMTRALAALRADPSFGAALAAHGLDTVRRRHTCAHRVDALLQIHDDLRHPPSEIHP